MPTDGTSRRLRVLEEMEVEAAPPEIQEVTTENPPPPPPPVPQPIQPQQKQALDQLTNMINQAVSKALESERRKDRMVMGRMNAVMTLAARLLAVRVLLLLSVVSAFVLGVMANAAQTWVSVATLSAFCLLVLAPLVIHALMDTRRTQPSPAE